MKVLVVGNGFDLAHGLPTKYTDFLDACDSIKKAGFEWIDDAKSNILQNLDIDEKKRVVNIRTALCDEYYSELFELVSGNFWIEYFLKLRSRIGENWFDFEEEIKEVVLFINYEWPDIRPKLPERGRVIYDCINAVLKCLNSKKLNIQFRDSKLFLKEVFGEYKNLIRAFEIYIDGYVNKLNAQRKATIANQKYTHLLSFNYSDTYNRVYGNNVESCFIHGKAVFRREANKNNTVLGIEDVYEDKEGNRIEGIRKEVLPFEKYIQRIAKQTDNKIYNWLDGVVSSEPCEVHFYGHSFAESDGDILGFIIDKANTVIFCLNEADMAEKIKNLAVILGRKKLERKVGLEEKSISFKLIEDEYK